MEHKGEDFEAPSEGFTIVRITMFPGRSLEAKRRLYKGIVERLGKLGISGDEVIIVLDETGRGTWWF